MSQTMKILIPIAALLSIAYILFQMRKLRIRMEDTIFWIILAVILAVFALVPQVPYFFSGILGIKSPANLIFLFVIALLIEKLFTVSMQLSLVEEKITVLSAEIALRCKDIEAQATSAPRATEPFGESSGDFPDCSGQESRLKTLEREIARLGEEKERMAERIETLERQASAPTSQAKG